MFFVGIKKRKRRIFDTDLRGLTQDFLPQRKKMNIDWEYLGLRRRQLKQNSEYRIQESELGKI